MTHPTQLAGTQYILPQKKKKKKKTKGFITVFRFLVGKNRDVVFEKLTKCSNFFFV